MTKILIIGESRGQWSALEKIDVERDLIFHVGGLGLLSNGQRESDDSEEIPMPKLRHLNHFNPFQSTAEGQNKLSELNDYITGALGFPIPVYAVPSSIDDPKIITKFRNNEVKINNFNIVDDLNPRYIKIDGNSEILLCGLPGVFSLHKLFHHNSNNNNDDTNSSPNLPMSGDTGDVWLTILHIGQFLDRMFKLSEQDPDRYNKAIKIFLCNSPPFREPLLHHLSIILKVDYTVSASLFFKNTASFNNLTAHTSLESFKQRFIVSKNKLDRILNHVSADYKSLIQSNKRYLHFYNLAIETWDKIPTTSSNLNNNNSNSNNAGTNNIINNNSTTRAENNSLIRNINDLYYTAFHHEWHLNISDPAHGYALFDIKDGRVSILTKNVGFDFSYRK